jgi:hypothetical protein
MFLAVIAVGLVALVTALALGPLPRLPLDHAAAKAELITR